MGCWNETCMITQLPIKEGDKIVIIPIRKIGEVGIDSSCYTDTCFKPLPIILRGKYDDYGRAYDVTGDVDQFIYIMDKVANVDKDHVLAYCQQCYGKNESPLIESYLKYIEKTHTKNLNYIMIHEEVFNLYNIYKDLFFDIKESIDRTYYYNNRYNIVEGLSMDDFKLRSKIDCAYTHNLFYPTRVSGATKESIASIINLDCNMNVLRKMWVPQTGSGGQGGVENQHKQFVTFYNKYVEENFYDEYDDENEEED